MQIDENVIKKLLSDKNAPQGEVQTDLKTALYVAACLFPMELDKNTSHNTSFIRTLLKDYLDFNPKTKLVMQKILDTLQELVSDGCVTCFAERFYVRTASLVTKELEVQGKPTDKFSVDYEWFEYERSVELYVLNETGETYVLPYYSDEPVILPGDVVEVRLCPEKKMAFVERITKPRVCVVGTMIDYGSKRVLSTGDNKLVEFQFVFSPESVGEARPGNVVIAEIVKRTNKRAQHIIQVKTRQVVHDLGKLNNIILLNVIKHNIRSSWPEGMSRAVKRVPDEVREEDIKGRRDLRELPLMTIDGEDARDFDDAVFVQKEEGKYRLYVAIADVSYYVKPGTVLDREAVERCNSVYFPNYVIPMLPEKLSNGICSLNPNVDRLCMVCEMVINSKGKTESYEFYPAVMNSHARLTYTEAWQMIDKGTAQIPEHEMMIEHVKRLHELYNVLAKARDNRGGFQVESDEVHFVFDEELNVTGLTPVVRNDAHKLIEECMIAANVAAASFIIEHKAQSLYRVHPKPEDFKLKALNSSLVSFGLSLHHSKDPSPVDYNNFCHQIEGRPDAKILGQMLLRSMSKATYSPDNIGHFGLALQNYSHFTSPIRRYADLQLHRAIKAILDKTTAHEWGKIGARSYSHAELVTLGERCTKREMEADYAEIDVDTELKCLLLKRFEGQLVTGTISTVVNFGAFITLNDFMVDGLLYVGNISYNYVNIDPERQIIYCPDGQNLRVGDQVQVIVGSVDVEDHKIDLLLPKSKKEKGMQPVQRSEVFAERKEGMVLDVPTKMKPLLDSIADLTSGSEKALQRLKERQEQEDAAKAEFEASAKALARQSQSTRRRKASAQVDAQAAESAAQSAALAPKAAAAASTAASAAPAAPETPASEGEAQGAAASAAKSKRKRKPKRGQNAESSVLRADDADQENSIVLPRRPEGQAESKPLTLGDLIRAGSAYYPPFKAEIESDLEAEPQGTAKAGRKNKAKHKNKAKKKKDKKKGKK